VLVVVAIIALLVAILLPTLAAARENARRTVCASQLKEMAHAIVMYNAENKDSLPGPLHQALELETVGKVASNDYEAWHLPHYIRRYFNDTSKGKKLTDNIVRCPTALKMFDTKNRWGDSNAERPFTYTLNNWWTVAGDSERIGTDPEQYFGWPGSSSDPKYRFWAGGPDASGRFYLNPEAGDVAKPKRVQQIKQPGREWAIGDAFRYNDETRPKIAGSGRENGDWRIGTYQSDWVERGNIPHAVRPFHDKGINVGMFDGHVEYQRPWRGSVNSKRP